MNIESPPILVERLTVALPAPLTKSVRDAAAAQHTTVSGWLADSIQDRLRLEALRRFLDSYEAEHGAITEEEIREVRSRLQSRQWE
jgi:hypothetical protein